MTAIQVLDRLDGVQEVVSDHTWVADCPICDGRLLVSGLTDDDVQLVCSRCEPAGVWMKLGLPVPLADQADAGGAAAYTVPRAGGRARSVAVGTFPASTVKTERVAWLWQDRIATRGLAVVAGEKALGKSLLTNAKLPAAVSVGKLPGDLYGQPAHVAVASAEDDWRSVIAPRLTACGADLDRVHGIEVRNDDGPVGLTLPDHVAQLEHALADLAGAGCPPRLLVVDPIGAFLGGSTDSHNDASVRRALAPLAAMADRLDLAVLVVAHLNKAEGTRLLTRVNGSGAFVNAARSVLGFVRDPDDDDGEQGYERVLVHVASNWGTYASSLAMRVEPRTVTLDDGTEAGVGYLDDLGESDIRIEDVQRGGEHDRESVEDAIIADLEGRGGKAPSLDVKEAVSGRVGCSTSTVDRAARRLGEHGDLTVTSGGFPRRTTWALAVASSPVASSSATPGDVTGESGSTARNPEGPPPQSRQSRQPPAREGEATENGGRDELGGRVADCLRVLKAGGDATGLYTAEEIRLARLCTDGQQ
jgi:hypothetical protein